MANDLIFNPETGMFEIEDKNISKSVKENDSADIVLKSRNGKEPTRKYDEKTGCFEYLDVGMRKKAVERKKLKLATDELQNRLDGIKKHFKRQNLINHIGKTGNSITGNISDVDRKTADIQSKHVKEYILRSKNKCD